LRLAYWVSEVNFGRHLGLTLARGELLLFYGADVISREDSSALFAKTAAPLGNIAVHLDLLIGQIVTHMQLMLRLAE
jgi:hypothetical protein